MASILSDTKSASREDREEQLGGQMSFLDHLDELRRRLMRSVTFLFVAVILCWFASGYVYNFLALPVRHALAEAQRRQIPLGGLTGQEQPMPLGALPEGERGRYVFAEATQLGGSVIPPGASVAARLMRDAEGQLGLFTEEPLIAGPTVIPRGVRLPVDPNAQPAALPGIDERLIIGTVMEPFSLYLKVSLYMALCVSVPFLLWQIWAFVSPGLYPHERSYALPFIFLSTIAFIIGGAFAYYVLFPPAAAYLLGLGHDFRLLLKATDYFDFIILIMLAMGVVFQMPAVTYVLARIGIVSARFLIKSWRIALILILVAAALLSPTSDVLNMMLFAAPMVGLYIISIFIAWIFGKERSAVSGQRSAS